MKANGGAALRSSQNCMPEERQIGPCPQRRTELGTQISYVNVDAGMDVVKQIPADMVGVFVYDEIIAAIPAPVGGEGPIPVGDLKVEAAREPEAVVVVVNPSDAVAVGRTEMLKTAMREWDGRCENACRSERRGRTSDRCSHVACDPPSRSAYAPLPS